MARICEVTGKGPIKGSIIWRSGKSKKSGGIGTHVTAITKRRFLPNLQRVKALRSEVTGKGPIKGSIIWRSGKSKKSGGIGTHVTAITKRRFLPNLQRVKAL